MSVVAKFRPPFRDGVGKRLAIRTGPLSLLLTTLSTPLLAAAPGGEIRTDIEFVPDVQDQFAKLALRPEALGFGIGSSPDPEQCRHYQGVVRRQGRGTPYLFVTRSGNKPDGFIPGLICSDGDHPGNLLVVKMESRDTNGERLRSNRLRRGSDISFPIEAFSTPPDFRDRVVTVIDFDGMNGWPNYGHPGGMQLIGDILALPLETAYSGNEDDNVVAFIDVSNPEAPSLRSLFTLTQTDDFSAGLVGVTPVWNDTLDGLKYLMLMTGKENKEVHLYRSLPTGGATSTDLADPNLDWELLQTWTEAQIEACLGGIDWHTGKGDAHQALNFVREGSMNGALYLVGSRNTTPLPSGDDNLDLYLVDVDAQGNPGPCFLTHLDTTHFTSKPIIGGGDSANFGAAGGVYVSPSGELIFYSSEYENDGPFQDTPAPGQQTVRFGEWRHREVVRPGSPTLRPTLTVGGPFVVDEGSSVNLSAQGEGPITKAWLQLFEDDDLGSSLPGAFDSDDWLMVDYQDWGQDDFDDFRELHYSDDAGSWRWFAPAGCTLRANDDDFGDDDFPGRFTKTLVGNGTVQEEADLDQVPNDEGDFSMDDEITSMQFFGDCDTYYGASMTVAWDFDGNGSFEVVGGSPAFSAAGLDGPSSVFVGVRAEHPFDGTALGVSPTASVGIQVLNVPPDIGTFTLEDEAGLTIGSEIDFVLLGLVVTARGTFTDVGTPDTHTATVDWDDGTIVTETGFDDFLDSFGGVVGFGSAHHAYLGASTYDVRFDVQDDDGGTDGDQVELRVLTPAEATEEVIDDLHDLLEDPGLLPDAADAIADALDELEGQNGGAAQNGALDKIEGGQLNAALVKLKKALGDLLDAEAAQPGLDFTVELNLLALVAKSVVVEQLQEATRGIALAEGHIAAGDAARAAGSFVEAVEDYRRALQRLH